MITLHWYEEEHTGDIAIKGSDYVSLCSRDFTETFRVVGIVGQEWEHISIDGGEWSSPSIIPTTEEILRADVDFLTMENEALEDDVEQAKADIDYLLMITEEE